MTYLKFTVGIFIVLAASRLIPHPPNFTSLLALSFYIPAIFGRKFIPSILISFFITDLIIGFHNLTLFTWGSVLLIGFLPTYFSRGITKRISGALLGALVFFIITNFGVWSGGMYEYNISGLITCYTMAIPFFAYSIISTVVFSILIEFIYKFNLIKKTIKLYSHS